MFSQMKHSVKYQISIIHLLPIIAILLLNPSNIVAKNINESASEIVKDIWDNRLKFVQPDEPIGVIPLQSSEQELSPVCRIFFSLIKSQLESVYNLKLAQPENLADLKAHFYYGVTSGQQAKRVGKLLNCKTFITGQVEDIGASLNVNLFVWNATTGNISYVADIQLRKDAALTALLLPHTGAKLELYSLKWRGDIWDSNVHAIAVGDVNGDGRNELVLATDDKLKVLAWKGIRFWDTSLKDFVYLQKPHQLKSVQRRIRTLHVADLNKNDRDEIYISIPIGKTYKVEWQDNSPIKPADLRLAAMKPDALRLTAEGVEFSEYIFLNLSSSAITGSTFLEYRGCFSGEQTTLLSIQNGEISSPQIHRIASDYNSLRISSTDGDDKQEFIVVDHLGHLKIFNQVNLIYQSNPIFGVGLEIIDLDGNGINEIICSSGIHESSVHGVNRPFQDNIFVLEWDGDTYSKKWKSETFDGSITDFTAADVDNDGILELVVCVRKRMPQADRRRVSSPQADRRRALSGSEIRIYTANYICFDSKSEAAVPSARRVESKLIQK